MPAVHVAAVHKHFGPTVALDGVDLAVEEGEIVGLLGPNGAGKTTLVRILATLLPPDRGSATVFGLDVVREAGAVRRSIGLTGQNAAVDGLLSGRENLQMFGELFHLPARVARRRADELLERFDLADAANRAARTYSGGMRRRLDLASSLLVRPRLLFLDEPTTGLDPRSRNSIWEIARELVAEGTTLLLTTQYLEEADQLADRIAVIDRGTIIAEGTGDELKDRVGGQVVDVVLVDATDRARALQALSDGEPMPDAERIRIPVNGDAPLATVGRVADALRSIDVDVRDLGLRRPTLDDVFLELTGTVARTDASGAEPTPDARSATGSDTASDAGDGPEAPPGSPSASSASSASSGSSASSHAESAAPQPGHPGRTS